MDHTEIPPIRFVAGFPSFQGRVSCGLPSITAPYLAFKSPAIGMESGPVNAQSRGTLCSNNSRPPSQPRQPTGHATMAPSEFAGSPRVSLVVQGCG